MRSERLNGKQARLAHAGRTSRDGQAPHQPVWFEYNDAAAREVTVAGSFNNWDVTNMRMAHASRDRWLRVMFLPPGRYEYLFVVDGRCVPDPRATESVPNVFGCVNSVLIVPAETPRNGCKRRILGRKPMSSPTASAELKSRRCRRANAPHRRLTPV